MTQPSPQFQHETGVSRLAPSPTGALHLGNARTFLVNWALARKKGWKLLLRIEDFDTPRIKPGAAGEVMLTLDWLGIEWDSWENPSLTGPRQPGRDWLLQSDDLEPYRAAMGWLAEDGAAYPCVLTRSQIEAAASAPQEGAHETPFPSQLRPPEAGQDFDFRSFDEMPEDSAAERPNWRLLVKPGEISFVDSFAGPQRFDVSKTIGDFVLWTKRGLPSYQLAVVVDDHRQRVTQVVRGNDLLESAARQLLLYRLLEYLPEPTYTHLPLVIGEDGHRLAKRHGDTRIDHYRSRGVPAEAVIGLIAGWCEPESARGKRSLLSAAEFRDSLDLSTMPTNPVVFTKEDDEWLLSTARGGR